MTPRQRVLGALDRTGYDRIPVRHEAVPEVNSMLLAHLGLANSEQLLRVLGDDFRYIAPTYVGRELRSFPDGSVEGYWGERYTYVQYEGGRYLESTYMPFADVDRTADLDRTLFPSADAFDFSTIGPQCDALGGRYAVCFGGAGDMDFINSIARARGVQRVLFDLATDDPVYNALLDARFEFYYRMHERTLQAADGRIDIVHVGDDFGTQRGPLISEATFEKYFVPRYAAYFDMAHRYGARTMMHMCGCVEPFLSRLIEIGLDIQDVVQPTTPEMDIAALNERYGDRLAFSGSMCVQTVLPHGSVEDVRREVQRRRAIFAKGGLLLGPTHAIQVNTPLANILAMYEAAGSLTDPADAIVTAPRPEHWPDQSDRAGLSSFSGAGDSVKASEPRP